MFASLGPAPERVLAPLLDPDSPAQASLLIEYSLRGGARPIYSSWQPGGSPRLSICPAWLLGSWNSCEFRFPAKTVRCSTALLGLTSLASRFALPDPKIVQCRVALEEDQLFRRLLPAGPASSPEGAVASPAGGDRTFGHLPHLLSVAGFPMRPGPPSRSPDDNALLPRVGEAKYFVRSLWITGILGTRIGNFFAKPILGRAQSVGCHCVFGKSVRSSSPAASMTLHSRDGRPEIVTSLNT